MQVHILNSKSWTSNCHCSLNLLLQVSGNIIFSKISTHRWGNFRSLWGCRRWQVQPYRSVLGCVNHWNMSAPSRYILKSFWRYKLFGEVPLASRNLERWFPTTTAHCCCMWRELSTWNSAVHWQKSLSKNSYRHCTDYVTVQLLEWYYWKCLAHKPCSVNLFRMLMKYLGGSTCAWWWVKGRMSPHFLSTETE